MIKYTEEGQDQRKKRLGDLRQRLSRIKRLGGYKDSLEWKDLKSIIMDFIEMQKREERLACQACEVGGYWSNEDNCVKKIPSEELVSDIKVARKNQRAYELIIDLIDDNSSQVGHLEKSIKSIEDTYKEAKEQLEA